MTIPKEVVEGLVKAQAFVRPVGKDGENSHHRYRYTSAEALIAEATGWLAAAGLAFVQCGWRFVPSTLPGTLPDRLEVTYMVLAGGEAWEMPPVSTPVIPEKGRPWDKAEATALTYSLGYALRGLLKIPRTDAGGDDVDQRDDRDHVPAERISVGDRVGKVLDGLEAATSASDLRLWSERWRSIASEATQEHHDVVKAAAELAKARIHGAQS